VGPSEHAMRDDEDPVLRRRDPRLLLRPSNAQVMRRIDEVLGAALAAIERRL